MRTEGEIRKKILYAETEAEKWKKSSYQHPENQSYSSMCQQYQEEFLRRVALLQWVLEEEEE